jgi:hypothetical protein
MTERDTWSNSLILQKGELRLNMWEESARSQLELALITSQFIIHHSFHMHQNLKDKAERKS